MATIGFALSQTEMALKKADVPDSSVDARLLLSHVTGLSGMELCLHSAQILTEEQEQRLSALLSCRVSRRPLQYLLKEQWFYGFPFYVDERVLIPRPETETLCELAITYLRQSPSPAVLDLCTGSGAIAVTLALECPNAHVTATDLSSDALAVASLNSAQNHAAIQFFQGDLFAPLAGATYDCIVSNPPYIETEACKTLQKEVQQEPLLALDGGGDGLAYYRRIAKEAAGHLHAKGLLCLEIGDTQGEAVCALLEKEGQYENITLHNDLSGSPRVVCAYALTSPT